MHLYSVSLSLETVCVCDTLCTKYFYCFVLSTYSRLHRQFFGVEVTERLRFPLTIFFPMPASADER